MFRLIINKIPTTDNIIWVNISAYLFGMLGALTFFIFTHLLAPKPAKLGSVNITQIVRQFIKQETSKNLPPEILKKEVSAFGVSLDRAVKLYSKENNIVLLLSEAVVAGNNDYTKIIQARLIKNNVAEVE